MKFFISISFIILNKLNTFNIYIIFLYLIFKQSILINFSHFDLDLSKNQEYYYFQIFTIKKQIFKNHFKVNYFKFYLKNLGF
jgi:hypothetical protein